jgi:hypothetical protein
MTLDGWFIEPARTPEEIFMEERANSGEPFKMKVFDHGLFLVKAERTEGGSFNIVFLKQLTE